MCRTAFQVKGAEVGKGGTALLHGTQTDGQTGPGDGWIVRARRGKESQRSWFLSWTTGSHSCNLLRVYHV
jgi:hypothetical protein